MPEDLFTQQQEAMRRARELHSRASSTNEKEAEPEAPPPTEPSPEPQKPAPAPRPDLFETLFKDKDKTIILALLILLSGENGDNSLIFALMYLLM